MILFLFTLFSSVASAQGVVTYNAPTPTLASIVSAASGTLSALTTVQITQDGATPTSYPNAPLVMTGNANSYVQAVIQNYSSGASAQSAYVLTGDLGQDTSFYFNLQQSNSKFSNSSYSAFPSSSSILYTSDSPLFIWADTNGGLNSAGGGTGHVVIGSSNAVTGNAALDISSGVVVVKAQNGLQMVAGSTISAGGGSLSISTAAATATTTPNILINASGQTTFNPAISSGTPSGSISGTFTQTTLLACQAASTQTLTLPAGCSGKVLLVFHGSAGSSVINSTITVGILQDGGYLTGESATKGIVSMGDPNLTGLAGEDFNLSFPKIVSGLTCAVHSWCLAFMTTSGTGTIESTRADSVFTAVPLP